MALRALNSSRDIFRVWFTWHKQAAIVFFIIVFFVMLFAYLSTPVYQSTAKILLLPTSSEGLILTSGSSESRIAPVAISDINTELELLTSNSVINSTIESFAASGGLGLSMDDKSFSRRISDGLKKAVGEIFIFLGLKDRLTPFEANVKTLKNSLSVEPVAMSNIILVKLQAEIPAAAQKVLNRLLDIYIKHHSQVFSKEEGVRFFKDQTSSYSERLEEAERKLRESKDELSVVDINRQKEVNLNLLADLSKQLNGIELSFKAKQSNIALFKEALNQGGETVVVTNEMRNRQSITELDKTIVTLLTKRSEISSKLSPNSRSYQEVTMQINLLRKDLKNEIMNAIKSEQMELNALEKRKINLSNNIDQLRAETTALNDKEKMLNKLEREVQLLQNNFMLYAKKEEDAKIYRERIKQNLANISIVDQASLPVEKYFPKRGIMFIVSIFVGFFGALGSPFIFEFLDHRLKTASEVEDILSLPVIAVFREENK